MTKDLAAIAEPKPARYTTTEEFIDIVSKKL
jgi:isocitrate dehydrogenase